MTVAKNKKKIIKKAVKKAVKKIAKKVIKKAVKKAAVKKVVKKPAVKKVAKKPAPKNKAAVKKPIQKIVKKVAVIKKQAAVVAKPVIIKPAAAKPIKIAPEAPEILQPITKKQIMLKKSQAVLSKSNRPRSLAETIMIDVDPMTIEPTKSTTLLGALEFTPYHPQGTEGYMSDHQREHFRKILAAWKLQLMQDVDATVVHLKEDAEFYADPVDRAAQEEGFNLELRARDRERKLIKKIEQSLDLINTNDYGYCEDCGAEIGIRRLEARPTAVKCIDCKTFQEIREKQVGGGS